jgi:hypothetical protein
MNPLATVVMLLLLAPILLLVLVFLIVVDSKRAPAAEERVVERVEPNKDAARRALDYLVDDFRLSFEENGVWGVEEALRCLGDTYDPTLKHVMIILEGIRNTPYTNLEDLEICTANERAAVGILERFLGQHKSLA